MDTDLRIPMTSEQKKLVTEATADEPEGMAAWARAVLLQAARERIENRQRQGLPGETAPGERETFEELADLWRHETGMYSSISKMVRHPAYLKIIDMGERVVPLILRELQERPDHWFTALKAITKQTPVPAGDQTNPKRAREAWLQWGKERGLID